MHTLTIHQRSIGYHQKGDKTNMRVWAPYADTLEIKINDETRMALHAEEQGYWAAHDLPLRAGDRYTFFVNGKEFPDPVSLSQPDGVHGPSEIIDLQAFHWNDGQWLNPPLDEYIFYELHTGAFTDEGTFAGIEKKLDHLKELGVTAIELMPVAAFPGNRNWGYDGVFPFAVHAAYGGAAGLQSLVDLCHRKDMAVVLDVVYNHFGPEGNCLEAYGPYLTDNYKTPWGRAINMDDAYSDAVRNYFIENALMWFRDFHVDALRLDAVHAIKDLGAVHFLEELRQRTDELSAVTGKTYYLIAECDLNDPTFIRAISENGYGMHAQWMDEFHHALRVAAGQERTGYYSDFNGIAHLTKSYKDAYVYDGQYSEHRKKTFGKKTLNAGEQFVVFSQNHDQVGNRMLGERSSALVSFSTLKLMAAAVIVSPYLPLLFMGEEWGATEPFLYFVSHTDPQLVEAVRQGRKKEFKEFHAEGEAPDPMDERTFKRSTLPWKTREETQNVLFNYYKALIRFRKRFLPLRLFTRQQLEVTGNQLTRNIILHRWYENRHVYCFMNFSPQSQHVIIPSSHALWQKHIDSASGQWHGHSTVPDELQGGDTVSLEAESILIISNHV
jgi:maltooligosyltrehalose trehalohydrolase